MASTVAGQSQTAGRQFSPAIAVEGVWAGYGSRAVLEGVTFQVESGSLIGIIGPNGCGKTTLLKVILGLLRPWRGAVEVQGQSPDEIRGRIGYVPQQESVDWNFPVQVRDVVMMGRYGRLGLFRRPSGDDRRIVMESLGQVGMASFADRQIGELSGGQQQRVFLARALAQEPEVLLLDEPLSGVDALSQHDVFNILKKLTAEGKTALVTTHDLSCVADHFAQVICLNKSVIALGPPHEVLTQDILSRTFDRHMLVLSAEQGTFVIDTGHFK